MQQKGDRKLCRLISYPLWYNGKMPCRDIYLPKWHEKGITTVADIVDDHGNVIDIDTIKKVYSIEKINPLHYLRV